MSLLDRLRGRLIVSIQPAVGNPMRTPAIVAAMAQASVLAGAGGVRVESVADIVAVRAVIGAPIIGIVKRQEPGFEPYITPTSADVAAILHAGADIVAFDATLRPRPEPLPTLIAAIHQGGGLAMADCADLADARNAQELGCDIVATTLCGYTAATLGTSLPALALCAQLAALGTFTICEGGIGNPRALALAQEAGADAMVVGTAITNLSTLVGEFVASLAKEIGR
ncbi:MAG: N-acetylmannosamine-6-phosphate 2-epimerase [Vulcanimicrobiaceae bacterium]